MERPVPTFKTIIDPTSQLPYDLLNFPLADEAQPPKLIVVLIPGNPGLARYYTSFLTSLLSHLPPTTTAYAVGHLGHSPSSSNYSPKTQPTLLDQVEHKRKFLEQVLKENGIGTEGKQTKLVLISHSIGSWISLKLLSHFPIQISSLHNLFPTISNMAQTPNGRRLSPLFSPSLHLPLSVSTQMLSFLPTSLLSPVIGLLSSQTDPSSKLTTTSLVQSPQTVISALTMAREEMAQVTSLDPLNPILREHGDKIRWYWAEGSSDGWVLPTAVDEICQVLDEAGWDKEKRVRCSEGLKHAFVLEQKGTESLAKRCAEWIRADLII